MEYVSRPPWIRTVVMHITVYATTRKSLSAPQRLNFIWPKLSLIAIHFFSCIQTFTYMGKETGKLRGHGPFLESSSYDELQSCGRIKNSRSKIDKDWGKLVYI